MKKVVMFKFNSGLTITEVEGGLTLNGIYLAKESARVLFDLIEPLNGVETIRECAESGSSISVTRQADRIQITLNSHAHFGVYENEQDDLRKLIFGDYDYKDHGFTLKPPKEPDMPKVLEE